MTPEQKTQLDDLIGALEDACFAAGGDLDRDVERARIAGDAIVAHVESMLAELRATAARYATLDLLHANGDVRIAFEEDGRLGVHLDDTAERAEGSWYGDNLDAVLDAAARDIAAEDAKIEAIVAARAILQSTGEGEGK